MYILEQKLKYRSKKAGEILPTLQDWTELGHADTEREAMAKLPELRPEVAIKWEGCPGERYCTLIMPNEVGTLFEFYRVKELP